MEAGEIIALIKALGGGSSLPPVTESDNGKVLTVVDEEWAAQGDITVGASMHDSYFVELTGETPTFAELQALYKSGRKLILDFGLNVKVALDASAEAVTYTVFIGESVILTSPGMTYYGTSKVIAMFYDDDGALGYHIYIIPNNKFIVTLTPTALDYSGTMDKTAAEITAAYKAGMEIYFRIDTFPGFDVVEIPCNSVTCATGYTNACFHGEIIEPNTGVMIVILTQDINDDSIAYYTHIYTLTPAS